MAQPAAAHPIAAAASAAAGGYRRRRPEDAVLYRCVEQHWDSFRQWVCSLPWRLRYLCGYDRKLCSEVVGAFVTQVMRSLRRRAKRLLGLDSVKQAHTGAVTFVQRFDSALRLNVHPHTLALDGVYVRGADEQVVLPPLAEPTAAEVAEVALGTAKRVGRILERHGRSLDGWCSSRSTSSRGSALWCLHRASTWCATTACSRPTPRFVRRSSLSLSLCAYEDGTPTPAEFTVEGESES